MNTTKIVIIDDNKDLVGFVKPLLEEHNCLVAAAFDGKTGLKVIKKENPDIILLDINLPDMSGNDVLLQLKKDEAIKDIPVIMLTVKDWQYDRSKALELGAYEYIAKPFDTHMLLRQITNVLEKKQKGEV